MSTPEKPAWLRAFIATQKERAEDLRRLPWYLIDSPYAQEHESKAQLIDDIVRQVEKDWQQANG